MNQSIRNPLISVASGAVLAVPVAAFSPGAFLPGYLAAGLLLALSVFMLLAAWHWGGGGRRLALLVAAAFLIRLVVGMGLSLAYPLGGYDSAVYKSGYLFPDAMKRDTDAYNIARSDQKILFNPDLNVGSDQYGGLAIGSALVYRYLSPDAHRPFLILIIGGLFFALGVPFLWRVVGKRFGETMALLATWIFVLYPDGIFFTSSQMREPFMLGLGAVGLWAALSWKDHRRGALLAGLFSAAGMFFFSTRSAVFVVGVLAFLFWLEFIADRKGPAWRVIGWAGLAIGVLAALGITWGWLREAAVWDRVLTVRGSGWLILFFKQVGERFINQTVVFYGLFQPVLPATIADSAPPLVKTIVILRSLGWYLLAPLLVYSGIRAWGLTNREQRRVVTCSVIAVIIWVLLASFRGGGDLTDNPRYRVLFLPWMALLAAWAVTYALEKRDAWLVRLLAVEVIFLTVFTQWYFARYFHWGKVLSLPTLGILISIPSALVIVGGLIWDLVKKK
jgi:hypothetical protein